MHVTVVVNEFVVLEPKIADYTPSVVCVAHDLFDILDRDAKAICKPGFVCVLPG